MVLEHQLLPYFQWLLQGGDQGLGALPKFALVFLGLAMAALVVGYAIAAVRLASSNVLIESKAIDPAPLFRIDHSSKNIDAYLKDLLDAAPERLAFSAETARWFRETLAALDAYRAAAAPARAGLWTPPAATRWGGGPPGRGGGGPPSAAS